MLGIVTRAGIPGAKLCCSLAEEIRVYLRLITVYKFGF